MFRQQGLTRAIENQAMVPCKDRFIPTGRLSSSPKSDGEGKECTEALNGSNLFFRNVS